MHTGKEAVAYEKLRIRGVRLPDGENEVFFVYDSHIFVCLCPQHPAISRMAERMIVKCLSIITCMLDNYTISGTPPIC